MKVDHKINPSIQNGETGATGRARRASRTDSTGDTEKTGSASSADAASTEISARAKEFAQAKSVAQNAADVREAKIQELRERIARKEYNVKPDDVADRMIREHMQSSGLG